MKTPDEQDYARWVELYADGMYRLAYRLCGQREIAEDLVQETFFEAWKLRAKLGQAEKAKAWLNQILRHRWMHYLRDQSRRIRLAGGIEGIDDSQLRKCGGGNVKKDDPARKLAESDEMQRALESIDADMRVPLLLVVMEGHTCQEVADMLGMPLGTVLSRIHRAKGALREYFKKSGRSVIQAREAEAT